MEKKKAFGALSALCGQAGKTRIVVGRKEIGSDWVKSTHYKDMEEFWDFILSDKIELEWYQVKGQDKVYVDVCKECNQYYDRGNTCACMKAK